MSTSSFPSSASLGSHADIIDLQQQVARLQALLEVSRQVHAAVESVEVLQSVMRIVVRELEMAGAHITDPPLTVGEMPPGAWDGCALRPAEQDGVQLTELVVEPGQANRYRFMSRAFWKGWCCRPELRSRTRNIIGGLSNGRVCSRIWTPHGKSSAACCRSK